VLGFREDIPFLALQLLPAAGTLGTLGLCLAYACQCFVAETVDRPQLSTRDDDGISVRCTGRDGMNLPKVNADCFREPDIFG